MAIVEVDAVNAKSLERGLTGSPAILRSRVDDEASLGIEDKPEFRC